MNEHVAPLKPTDQVEHPSDSGLLDAGKRQLRTALQQLTSVDMRKAMEKLYEEYAQFVDEETAQPRTPEAETEPGYRSRIVTPIRLTEHLWLHPRIYHIFKTQTFPVWLHVFDDRTTVYAESTEPAAVWGIKEHHPGRFDIFHREVAPELRHGGGLGTCMGDLIERFVDAAAHRRRQDQTLSLTTAQYNVIDWFVRRGYAATDQELLMRIREGIASGDLVRVRTNPNKDDDDYIYPKDTPVVEQTGSVSAAAAWVELAKTIPFQRSSADTNS